MKIMIFTHKEDSKMIMDQFYEKSTMISIEKGSEFRNVALSQNALSIYTDDNNAGDNIEIIMYAHNGEELNWIKEFLSEFEKQPEIVPLLSENKIFHSTSLLITGTVHITFRYPIIPKFNITEPTNAIQFNIELHEHDNRNIDDIDKDYIFGLAAHRPADCASTLDQIKSQFFGRRWGRANIHQIGPDALIVQSKNAPIIGFAHNYEIPIESCKEPRFSLKLTCPSPDDAAKVGDKIYQQLVGRYEYINNQIILNVYENEICVFICADTNIYPIVLYD